MPSVPFRQEPTTHPYSTSPQGTSSLDGGNKQVEDRFLSASSLADNYGYGSSRKMNGYVLKGIAIRIGISWLLTQEVSSRETYLHVHSSPSRHTNSVKYHPPCGIRAIHRPSIIIRRGRTGRMGWVRQATG